MVRFRFADDSGVEPLNRFMKMVARLTNSGGKDPGQRLRVNEDTALNVLGKGRLRAASGGAGWEPLAAQRRASRPGHDAN